MPRVADVLRESDLEGLRAPLIDADFLTACRVCQASQRLADTPHVDLGPDGSVYLCTNGCAPLLLVTRPGPRIPDSGCRLGAWVIRNPETLLFRPPSTGSLVKFGARSSALQPWIRRGYHLAPTHQQQDSSLEGTLESLVSAVPRLLGPTFDRIAAADARGLQSPTPPPRRHRLMELIEGARRTLESQAHPDPIVVADVVELDLARHAIGFWEDASALPDVLKALEDPDAYPHSLVTLAAARLLREAGNAVHLEIESGATRTPDLRIAVAPADVAVECKAPRTLQRPQHDLSQENADRVIRRAAKKAGFGPGGQLAPHRLGLLVVGGTQLSNPTLHRLRGAAEGYFTRSGSDPKHIAAIGVVSIGILLSESRPSNRFSLASILSLEVARNLDYAGSVTLETESVTWGPPSVPGQLREVRLEGEAGARSSEGS